MSDEWSLSDLPELTAAADRLDALAETADLMDDEPTALSLRNRAALLRARAQSLLDD